MIFSNSAPKNRSPSSGRVAEARSGGAADTVNRGKASKIPTLPSPKTGRDEAETQSKNRSTAQAPAGEWAVSQFEFSGTNSSCLSAKSIVVTRPYA
jgi:hypothetical protein